MFLKKLNLILLVSTCHGHARFCQKTVIIALVHTFYVHWWRQFQRRRLFKRQNRFQFYVDPTDSPYS